MEYLYISMFLQELGKDINAANIQKVFAALEMEADDAKVQLLIPALSVLTAVNQKKAKKAVVQHSFYQQLDSLQKRFETLEDSMSAVDERLVKLNVKQPLTCEADWEKERAEETVKPEETGTASGTICQEESAHEQPARYVYGISDKGVRENLGAIGLNGSEVYTIPYKDMCVVVHDCTAEPYKSEDETVVKDWLFTQQEVLDAVGEKFGVVLPMSFDMIIEGKNGSSSEQMVKDWLESNYKDFQRKIVRLKNKQEFGVQVILDTGILSEKLIETDEKLKAKKKEIDVKPEGIAYMERELLKDLLKEKIEEKADEYFREFYSMIKKCTDDIVIGKVKKVGGSKQMLMNLSCLVNKDRIEELGKVLEEIEKTEDISVRFSGPWAPYSFVTPEKGVTKNGDGQLE